jgi:hypothetical protein
MVRGIDHLVMVVNALEAARGVYERLGFTTTPRALHPFGTENFLVQMQGNFLEVVGIADAEIIPPHGPGVFSFARGNADFLSRREGMSRPRTPARTARTFSPPTSMPSRMSTFPARPPCPTAAR